MKVVLKIGGSILFKDGNLDVNLIKTWIKTIREMLNKGMTVGIVVGGGKPARDYIHVAKQLGINPAYQDLMGIESARQNARLFIGALQDAYPIPPADFPELIRALSNHNLVICGGFQPGQSTNAVASIFAEHINADFLVNLTSVEKVYNADPNKNANAVSFDRLTYNEFTDIIANYGQEPGKYSLFDHLGLAIIKRSNIKLVFINGRNPNNLLDLLEGKKRGTIVEN